MLAGAQALRLKARGAVPGLQIHITLVEADGTSRSRPLTLSTNRQEQVLPVADLKPGSGVKLPLGFPGRWNYWLSPAKGRGTAGDRLRREAVEHLQISFRPERTAPQTKGDAWADISSVALAPR